MEISNSFQKILIAVDQSEYSLHAAEYGFELANKLHAKVGLVHINEMPIAVNITGDPILGDAGMIMPNMMDIQQESAQRLFEKIKAEYAAGMEVEEFILDGDVTSHIIDIAKDFNASLIVMGTHGRSGFSHFLSGSIAESVTRKANCPVLIVPNKN